MSVHCVRPIGRKEIGTSLFRALFAGEVASLFHASLSSLPGEGYGLRIRLELDLRNPELAPLQELPWELLCRPETGDFLVLVGGRPSSSIFFMSTASTGRP